MGEEAYSVAGCVGGIFKIDIPGDNAERICTAHIGIVFEVLGEVGCVLAADFACLIVVFDWGDMPVAGVFEALLWGVDEGKFGEAGFVWDWFVFLSGWRRNCWGKWGCFYCGFLVRIFKRVGVGWHGYSLKTIISE
jgi:hypothetical protein